MIDLLIYGINGTNGKSVYKCATNNPDFAVTCGIDSSRIGEFNCPVYKSLLDVKNNVDVVVDLTEDKDSIKPVIDFALENKCAVVLCVTAPTQAINDLINEASKHIPIFVSSNYSIAVNLLAQFIQQTAKQYDNYDIEIIDYQSNTKMIAPSGTTNYIVESIKEVRDDLKTVNGRKGTGKRGSNEIGIHSVRGGNIVGNHRVMFVGPNETIAFEHNAFSRDLYAKGALRACEFIVKKTNGFYNMNDYFKNN